MDTTDKETFGVTKIDTVVQVFLEHAIGMSDSEFIKLSEKSERTRNMCSTLRSIENKRIYSCSNKSDKEMQINIKGVISKHGTKVILEMLLNKCFIEHAQCCCLTFDVLWIYDENVYSLHSNICTEYFWQYEVKYDSIFEKIIMPIHKQQDNLSCMQRLRHIVTKICTLKKTTPDPFLQFLNTSHKLEVVCKGSNNACKLNANILIEPCSICCDENGKESLLKKATEHLNYYRIFQTHCKISKIIKTKQFPDTLAFKVPELLVDKLLHEHISTTMDEKSNASKSDSDDYYFLQFVLNHHLMENVLRSYKTIGQKGKSLRTRKMFKTIVSVKTEEFSYLDVNNRPKDLLLSLADSLGLAIMLPKLCAIFLYFESANESLRSNSTIELTSECDFFKRLLTMFYSQIISKEHIHMLRQIKTANDRNKSNRSSKQRISLRVRNNERKCENSDRKNQDIRLAFYDTNKVDDAVKSFFELKCSFSPNTIDEVLTDIDYVKETELFGCKKDTAFTTTVNFESNLFVYPAYRHTLEDSFNSILSGLGANSSAIMKYEMHRLSSFKDFPGDNSPSTLRLALNGWFSTGNGKETKCFSCGVCYSNWQCTSDPKEIHQSLSPHCLVVTGLDSQNVPSYTRNEYLVNGNIRESNSSTLDESGICEMPNTIGNNNKYNLPKHQNASNNDHVKEEDHHEAKNHQNYIVKTSDGACYTGYQPAMSNGSIINGNMVETTVPDNCAYPKYDTTLCSRISEDQLSVSNAFVNGETRGSPEKCTGIHQKQQNGGKSELQFCLGGRDSSMSASSTSNHSRSRSHRREYNHLPTSLEGSNGHTDHTDNFHKSKSNNDTSSANGITRNENDDKELCKTKERPVPQNHHFKSANGPEQEGLFNKEMSYQLPQVKMEHPRYPQYVVLAVRISSFKDWPSYMTQSERDLAVAGFFYRGYSDEVTCYHCGITLANWQGEDDACVEHARWKPDCYYIRKYKGDDFVKLIQIAVNQLQQAQNNENRQSDEQPQARAPPPVTNRIVKKEVLDKINEMGFEKDDISRCVGILRRKSGNRDITVEEILEVLIGSSGSEREGSTEITRHAIDTRTISRQSSSDSSTSSNASYLSRDGPVSTSTSIDGSVKQQEPKVLKGSDKTQTMKKDKEVGEAEENRRKVECKVCLDREVGMIFMPCGHICACYICSQKLSKCPVCRTYIKKKVRGYLS